jgi:glycosyltransferase involved in cell wall biosynthesis
MKIFFLVPYPIGRAPSQRFRFEQYFDLLRQNKIEWRSESFWDTQSWEILYKQGYLPLKSWGLVKGFSKRLIVLFRLSSFNFVFIHRECTPIGPPFFEWVIAKILRKKIIYDLDDSIWLPNTSEENKIASFFKWHSKVQSICVWSYKISAGNGYLAAFAKAYNPNVVINPTTIDTENLHNLEKWTAPPKSERLVIGWTGTHSTMQYLQPLVPVLQALEKKIPFSFVVISNKKPDLPLASLIFIPWNKEHEIPDLLRFDIGVMPLIEDAWSKGKCGFKALQYMALGIPTVASPIGVNSKIIDQGRSGLLCTTDEEWLHALEKLLLDASLRKRIGECGRTKVIGQFSVLSNSPSFLRLFE